MKFMLQIIADVSIFGLLGSDDSRARGGRIAAFNRALDEAGVWVTAEGLDDPTSAVTVRFESGSEPIAGDGPFADRDEQLVGYWIVEVDRIDEAVSWAREAPLISGAIEVRQLLAEPVMVGDSLRRRSWSPEPGRAAGPEEA